MLDFEFNVSWANMTSEDKRGSEMSKQTNDNLRWNKE